MPYERAQGYGSIPRKFNVLRGLSTSCTRLRPCHHGREGWHGASPTPFTPRSEQYLPISLGPNRRCFENNFFFRVCQKTPSCVRPHGKSVGISSRADTRVITPSVSPLPSTSLPSRNLEPIAVKLSQMEDEDVENCMHAVVYICMYVCT